MRKDIIDKIKKIQSESELKEFVKNNFQELSEMNLEKVQGGSETMTLEDFAEKQRKEQEEREIMNLLIKIMRELTKTDEPSELHVG